MLAAATLLAAGFVAVMAADALVPPLAVGVVGFTCCYAACQTTLFTLFGELYGTHPGCSRFAGYISSSASIGRFAGPIAANAAFVAAAHATAASRAAAYVWAGNAAVVLLLGAGPAALCARLLRPSRA